MRRDTRFDLASLTKVVATTTALMRLYDQQRFALDDRVADFLPCFGQGGRERITIRHLLTHSSGLPAWAPLYQQFDPAELQDRRETFYELIARLPLLSPPGRQARYSDLGFIILGAVIEALSGMPLDRFCSQHLFTPLGLDSTGYRRLPSEGQDPRASSPSSYAATEVCPWRKRLLRGEVHDENAYAMGGVAGHAGLFGTAADLFRFTSMLLDCLDGRASSFLSPQTVATFTHRQGIPAGSTWALGWDTPSAQGSTAGRYFSPRSIGHTGFTGTSLWIDLLRRVTVICLTNRVHPSRHQADLKRFRPQLHDCIMQELRKEKLRFDKNSFLQ